MSLCRWAEGSLGAQAQASLFRCLTKAASKRLRPSLCVDASRGEMLTAARFSTMGRRIGAAPNISMETKTARVGRLYSGQKRGQSCGCILQCSGGAVVYKKKCCFTHAHTRVCARRRRRRVAVAQSGRATGREETIEMAQCTKGGRACQLHAQQSRGAVGDGTAPQ